MLTSETVSHTRTHIVPDTKPVFQGARRATNAVAGEEMLSHITAEKLIQDLRDQENVRPKQLLRPVVSSTFLAVEKKHPVAG